MMTSHPDRIGLIVVEVTTTRCGMWTAGHTHATVVEAIPRTTYLYYWYKYQ